MYNETQNIFQTLYNNVKHFIKIVQGFKEDCTDCTDCNAVHQLQCFVKCCTTCTILLFRCTSDCRGSSSLQLPRLGWRPSALLGLLVLFCIIARPSAPLSSSLHSLLPGARVPAPRRASACAPAQVDTGCSSVVVSVTVPRRDRDVSVTVPRRRRRRRQRRQVHGQRRLHCWDPQVPHHHCRLKAPPCPTSWPNFLECLCSNPKTRGSRRRTFLPMA